jgi:hypothetical protein
MLFTIGHSNHPIEDFVKLLKQHKIEVLADVRSQPYSRMHPHYNAEALKTELSKHGVKYVPMGEQLGGRPKRQWMYDSEGHADYRKMSQDESFLEGLERLEKGMAQKIRTTVTAVCWSFVVYAKHNHNFLKVFCTFAVTEACKAKKVCKNPKLHCLQKKNPGVHPRQFKLNQKQKRKKRHEGLHHWLYQENCRDVFWFAQKKWCATIA